MSFTQSRFAKFRYSRFPGYPSSRRCPDSLTCGMPYNYFPRGRVELRRGKAMVYLPPTLCTPEIFARIHQVFSLPDEMQVSFKADGSRHYRSIQEEQEG